MNTLLRELRPKLTCETAMPDWFRNIVSLRALSLVIAFVYLGITSFAALSNGKLMGSLLIVGGALVLPLACIWFGDEMGEYIGTVPGPGINRKSPGWMVKLGGWVLLLFPAILFLFTYKI